MNRHRFLFLDGMRGVAAFAVLYMHAGFGFGVPYFAHHAYLAVDFFFALSGFVVAFAYDSRIKSGLRFPGFARIRLIRLHPMILAGAVIGALAFDPHWQGSTQELTLLDASIFFVLLLGLLFHTSVFPVNTPVWSLFFELTANGCYFFSAGRPGRDVSKSLISLAMCGAVLVPIIHLAGGLDAVGVSSLPSFLAGLPRVAYSFGFGVLMFRNAWHEFLPRLPDIAVAALLAVIFAVPDCGWWYDAAAVLFVMPLLLGLGARARVSPSLAPVWIIFGALSYPVYIIHEPVLRAVFRLCGHRSPLLPYAAMALAILLAYVLLRFYDEPVRTRLTALARPKKLADAQA